MIGSVWWYPKKRKHGQVMELDDKAYYRVRFADGTWGRYAPSRLHSEFKQANKKKYPDFSLWTKETVRISTTKTTPKVKPKSTPYLELILYREGEEILRRTYHKYSKRRVDAKTINTK